MRRDVRRAMAAGLAAAALASGRGARAEDGGGFALRSPAFANGGEIPARHTCDGEDVSPALEWTAPPAGTRAFALIVDDPDAPDPAAPKTIWVHWILVDLPPETRALPEGIERLPAGAQSGRNDWRQRGWRGPCPPIGRHRYFFRLYALDAPLGGEGSGDRASVDRAMAGHVLGRAELFGTYARGR